MSSKNVNPDHYKIAGRDRREKQPGAKSTGKVQSRKSMPSRAAIEERLRHPDMNEEQQPSKAGVRSSTIKNRTSRSDLAPIPPARPVAGAFGKTGSLSPTEEEIIRNEPAPPDDRDDFLERRRRQNRKARK